MKSIIFKFDFFVGYLDKDNPLRDQIIRFFESVNLISIEYILSLTSQFNIYLEHSNVILFQDSENNIISLFLVNIDNDRLTILDILILDEYIEDVENYISQIEHHFNIDNDVFIAVKDQIIIDILTNSEIVYVPQFVTYKKQRNL